MSKLFRFPQIIVILIMFSFVSLAAVVFTPAYPELTRQFRLSASDAQWMMTVFLFGTAIGRLPYGPIANRFGRKNTLFIGLTIALIGTLITLSGGTYFLICTGRFIQALGCSVTLKIGYTMIADVHEGPKATKALSYAMLAYAILPGIGTAVSGFLTPKYGWQGGFWFFLIFTVLFFLLSFSLPETLKRKDPNALQIKKIAKNYAVQFKNRYLVLWSCLMGLSTAVIFIFSQEAPFVAIDIMGLDSAQYGLLYLVPAFGISAGSFFTAWQADNMSPMRGMLLGIVIIFIGAISMGMFFLGHWANGWALFIPQIVIQFGDAILYTFASSQGLTESKDKSNASAVMLFINSLVAVVGTYLAGTFAPKALMSMPIIFILITGIMLILWLIVRSHCKSDQK